MTMICRKTMRVCDTPGMCSPFGGCSDPPPATTTEQTPCGEDAGTESAVPDYAAIIESTLGAWKDHQRSVKWLLSQCEEYQRRAHAAEMALLEARLEAQKAAVGWRWWRR
jgi:hypothetical protein